ncbi:MAG TPA: PQQ-binding-like beta-propeller repeat protein [Stellaceae bacterium]|nr:PQQ-binding-like beta-propeller repeat protein [Stellaceae bacterium]
MIEPHRPHLRLPLLLCLLLFASFPTRADEAVVVGYHNTPDRSGRYVMPGLTAERARGIHLDAGFNGDIAGHVYAQPIYWRPAGATKGVLIVATEDDTVYALDADSGATLWRTELGKPVPRSSLRCGNINPLGITGTPAIDARRETAYFDAMVAVQDRPQHLIFALALRDGSIRQGWPLNVTDALARQGLRFNARDQNERGAVTIAGDRLFVPFGGHWGDCGDYHGWVVGVALDHPEDIIAWTTRAQGGGIWAPGGIVTDGRSLFIATGNTMSAKVWSDGEAAFRLGLDLKRFERPSDYFAPSDWQALDDADLDLGGSNPMLLDVPSGGETRPLLLALGKDGKAYLLDRNNLGGIGGALAVETVSTESIRTAPAAFRSGNAVMVAFQGRGAACPSAARGPGLTVLKIVAEPKPEITTLWCGSLRGAGSAIATVSDANGADPIVWITGAEGDNRLHGFKGETGEELSASGAAGMAGLRHFGTILAVNNRLYVAADGRVYAFAF